MAFRKRSREATRVTMIRVQMIQVMAGAYCDCNIQISPFPPSFYTVFWITSAQTAKYCGAPPCILFSSADDETRV